MYWPKELKAQTRFREPLSAHTTLGIGGPAEVWIRPNNVKELRQVICHCAQEGLPYFIIGRGSNILAGDNGFKGVVICLNSGAFTKMDFKENCVSCGAGLSLNRLISQAKRRRLGGMEFLAGVPATIAGALVMNAGTGQRSIGALIKSVTVMDKRGSLRLLYKKQIKFGYRQSSLKSYAVLKAVFKLIRRSPEAIKEEVAANLAKKRKTQDLNSKSAGCVFKNPQHSLSAGQMIEVCGLKKVRRGGAEISGRHANYIINRDGAKAKDVLYLMGLAQRQVKKKFGILLEPEIKIVK